MSQRDKVSMHGLAGRIGGLRTREGSEHRDSVVGAAVGIFWKAGAYGET
jgi:hypothetical protein